MTVLVCVCVFQAPKVDHQHAVKEYNRSAADKVSNLFLSVCLSVPYICMLLSTIIMNFLLYVAKTKTTFSLFISLSHLRLKIYPMNFDLSQFF